MIWMTTEERGFGVGFSRWRRRVWGWFRFRLYGRMLMREEIERYEARLKRRYEQH
jgi:hypothetical protein